MRNLISKHQTLVYVIICAGLCTISLLIPGWTGVMR